MDGSITIKTPGKLMIAGEYAVLEPYQPSIVTAVDRFIHTTLEESQEYLLSLHDFNLINLPWKFEQQRIHFQFENEKLAFVQNAMLVTLQYAQEKQFALKPVHIHVKSELQDKSGIKYGLGSSAAVSVSVVQGLLTYLLPEQPSSELVFKLAAIAHVTTQGSGSGADIAASAYGGMLQYASFQAEWLLGQRQTIAQIVPLVEMEWEYLSIKQLQLPAHIQMIVAWTGTAASTKNLVAEIKKLKTEQQPVYQQFLQESEKAVDMIMDGMHSGSLPMFFDGIDKNRLALRELGLNANVPIETAALEQISVIAKQFNGTGKLSGAGGGDCGIAFMPIDADVGKMKEMLLSAGIQPLDLKLY